MELVEDLWSKTGKYVKLIFNIFYIVYSEQKAKLHR